MHFCIVLVFTPTSCKFDIRNIDSVLSVLSKQYSTTNKIGMQNTTSENLIMEEARVIQNKVTTAEAAPVESPGTRYKVPSTSKIAATLLLMWCFRRYSSTQQLYLQVLILW